MKEILINKINELVELAKSSNEPNIQIVLLGLLGALHANQDDLLADNVQEFIKNVLMPKLKNKIEIDTANKN